MSATALPNDLRIARLAVVTGAANAHTQTIIKAAPAAPKRYRVWYFGAALDYNSPAGRVRIRFHNVAGLADFLDFLLTDAAPSFFHNLPGGVVLNVGDPLAVMDVPSVGAMIYECTILYTLENA